MTTATILDQSSCLSIPFLVSSECLLSMPAFEDSLIDGRKRVDVRFTAARVAEAEGGLKYEEVWLLTGPEAVDDWNNWVVAIRMLNVGRVPWIINRIVHVYRHSDH